MNLIVQLTGGESYLGHDSRPYCARQGVSMFSGLVVRQGIMAKGCGGVRVISWQHGSRESGSRPKYNIRGQILPPLVIAYLLSF